jgi:prepilin-type N-terminal cleavage/methylation domain-containing protein/prepilin-type processing-associated H-X9-DG protein
MVAPSSCPKNVLRPGRSAFTLIELLVVMAILSVLIGLLLPAVQKVREAANRMKCQSNLKQISLALHHCHSAYGCFPQSRTAPNGMSFSVHSRILPFVEQDNLSRQVDFTVPWSDDRNAAARAARVPIFVCPSDPLSRVPPDLAPTSYRANEGTSIVMWYGPSDAAGNNAAMPPDNGPFFVNGPYRVADITDGTSNTAAFSEHVTGDFSQAVATDRADTFEPGTHPTSADQAYADCQALDPNDLGLQGYSNVGAPWLYGYHSTTSYWHAAPPGARSCMFPPSRIMTTANSYHTNGVNVALCDGSVRFVSYGVSLGTWRALGTRNGGEVPGGDY